MDLTDPPDDDQCERRIIMKKILVSLAVVMIMGCQTTEVTDSDPKSSDFVPVSTPLREEETLAYRFCEADSDCLFVNNGCCDCANGGEGLAIHKDQRTAFQERFDCSNVACTEMARDCGNGTVSCVEGICQYKGPHSCADIGKEFDLKIGEAAFLQSEDIQVTLIGVTEDSRCPSDATCVWEGQVTVTVDARVKDEFFGTLNLTSRAAHEDLASKLLNGYGIRLLDVQPYPEMWKEITPSDYSASFIVIVDPIVTNAPLPEGGQ